MTIDTISAFVAFAFVSSITPGPNNLMLLASGANFGLRRSVPHMLGIGVGFTVMIVLVGIGLMGLFDAVPVSYTVLKIVSLAYLVWLACKIATAAPPDDAHGASARPAKVEPPAPIRQTTKQRVRAELRFDETRKRSSGAPLTFLQAAAFQWVNPKAWTMALTAITLYAPDRSLAAIALVALIFGAVNLPSVSCWTLLGRQMQRILTSNARLRAFNWTMAALLLASLWPVLAF